MSEKCKGQRLCMSRDAHEALHAQLEAKDAEIAELRRQLETWRAAEHAAVNKGEAIKRGRDEARECVGRLYKALEMAHRQMAHRAGCVTVRPSKEWGAHGSLSFEHCECDISTVRAALAATPEHLRR